MVYGFDIFDLRTGGQSGPFGGTDNSAGGVFVIGSRVPVAGGGGAHGSGVSESVAGGARDIRVAGVWLLRDSDGSGSVAAGEGKVWGSPGVGEGSGNGVLGYYELSVYSSGFYQPGGDADFGRHLGTEAVGALLELGCVGDVVADSVFVLRVLSAQSFFFGLEDAAGGVADDIGFGGIGDIILGS